MGCSQPSVNETSVNPKLGQVPGWLKGRPRLEMLHFNDVYNIEERATSDAMQKIDANQVVAGASRFVYAFDRLDSGRKLVLFSGDLFSPSHCKCRSQSFLGYFFQ